MGLSGPKGAGRVRRVWHLPGLAALLIWGDLEARHGVWQRCEHASRRPSTAHGEADQPRLA